MAISAQLAAPIATTPSDLSVTAETLALASRAERQALTERIAAAEERYSAAAAGRKPTIALSGAVDFLANPNPRIFPRQGEWRQSWEVKCR